MNRTTHSSTRVGNGQELAQGLLVIHVYDISCGILQTIQKVKNYMQKTKMDKIEAYYSEKCEHREI